MAEIIAVLSNIFTLIFVVGSMLAYLINLVIPMDEPLSIGLILLATCAGAPFLPKLVQMAKGNVAIGVGLNEATKPIRQHYWESL